MWDLESRQELRTLAGHSDWVYGVAVTADGRRAVSASRDRTLKVWVLESGQELRSQPLSNACQTTAPLRIRELEAWGKLGAQNPILRGQIFAL